MHLHALRPCGFGGLRDKRDQYIVAYHCGFHSNNLTVTIVSRSCFDGLIESLYCASKSLDMGSHSLRTLYSVPGLVKQRAFRLVGVALDPTWRRVSRGLVSLQAIMHSRGMVLKGFVKN